MSLRPLPSVSLGIAHPLSGHFHSFPARIARAGMPGRKAGLWICLALCVLVTSGYANLLCAQATEPSNQVPQDLANRARHLLADENLVAWCIVPFDAAKRTPDQRARMLKELGIGRCAYDWRQEHVPEFEQEILAYQQHGIEYHAFWDVHPAAFQLFDQYTLSPAIWKMIPDPGPVPPETAPSGDPQAPRVQQAVEQLVPLAKQTRELGCQLSLYNHGGWAGEPDTMIRVCESLRQAGYPHVGIVWNFHHGHQQIDQWRDVFTRLKPYLHCLNLNGMNPGAQPKILPIGQGTHEQSMIQVVLESDYEGPIGILDHLPEVDSRVALEANLKGLRQLRQGWIDNDQTSQQSAKTPETFDPAYVEKLLREVRDHSDADRGVQVFAANRFACLSCHRIDRQGGSVGPALTEIGKQRSAGDIAASILWPNHQVEDQYRQLQILTVDGRIHRGMLQAADEQFLEIKDPTGGSVVRIETQDIEQQTRLGSVMPEGISQAMTLQQQADLVRFLTELGRGGEIYQEELRLAFAHSHPHQSAPFPLSLEPRHPRYWPNHDHPVNRQRIYGYYSKQANYYRNRRSVPLVLEAFPSLDGTETGHWGNQNEETWRDGRWNDVALGQVLAGITQLNDQVVSRGVNVQIAQGISVCYDLDLLTPRALWEGGFLKFSDTRHGFLDALRPNGTLSPVTPNPAPEGSRYLGMYRGIDAVAFAWQHQGIVYLDSLHWRDRQLVVDRQPLSDHPLKSLTDSDRHVWPETYRTRVSLGDVGGPYEVDTIPIPKTVQNDLFFLSGLDFLSDGSALVATMQGDVWKVTGFSWETSNQNQDAIWKRFASGLNQPLGLKVIDDRIYVQCRDQLMELIDTDQNQEADFYRCVNKAFQTSPAGHDYICGLQADEDGNFYTASGNQGLLRLDPKGQTATVLATGFRNPDGLGRMPDGTLTVPCSEGDWTPASMVCAVPPETTTVPHFGYGGPRGEQPPSRPWYYLPRGIDNSSAEQVWCDQPEWGPLHQFPIHLSFGMGRHFYVIPDSQHSQQAAVIPLPGDFDSGVHRGRFHPVDGQLYVVGMTGWGSYTPDDGCFQRVRYTGRPWTTPTGIAVHQNGVWIKFNQPIDSRIASDVKQHFAQCWNYRYSQAYGSPELAPSHPGMVGHDSLAMVSAHVLGQGKELFLEIPDLQPVSQLHLNIRIGPGSIFPEDGIDLFVTAHELAPAFEDFPGFRPRDKLIASHPLQRDMSLLGQKVENPFQTPLTDARPVPVRTGQNLTYQDRDLVANPGEPLAVTLINTDVVPHNWVLVRPRSLSTVGKLANHLIADPMAAVKQYVPPSDDVLVYTDVVDGGQEFTIFFQAPQQPGKYPFLCTFPGHWMVMNGMLTVRQPDEDRKPASIGQSDPGTP